MTSNKWNPKILVLRCEDYYFIFANVEETLYSLFKRYHRQDIWIYLVCDMILMSVKSTSFSINMDEIIINLKLCEDYLGFVASDYSKIHLT